MSTDGQGTRPRRTKPFTVQELAGLTGCVLLALAAEIGTVPIWVLATAAALGVIRLGLARRGSRAPSLAVRVTIAILGCALLYLHFRTFNGLTAGGALLSLMTGLKLLETDSRRDLYVLTLLVYFLVLASLLQSDSFWLLAYAVGVCWVTTATLFRLATAAPPPAWHAGLRFTGRLLLQALPLTLAFWLLFPRFAGPLWQLPTDGNAAQSGLSDHMSPGDINELALSDEIAFRVRFEGAPPPAAERYWRGPVLHTFDGRSWRRGFPGTRLEPLVPEGSEYSYTVTLEPNQHEWLFALDWPSRWDIAGASLTPDYTLIRREPVSRSLEIRAVSHTHVAPQRVLDPDARQSDIRLTARDNPRTRELARKLRAAHPGDADYVRAVLDMFARQAFYYTLTPPALGADSVDAFLFDTRRGFCGHYASAFAVLMRAAGIPARVVTGYQGGILNPYSGTFIVRQSEAHAWDEVWIDGEGWRRVDPTSVIAPEHVDPAVLQAATATLPRRWQVLPAWVGELRLRIDAMRQLWRERILLFDQRSQEDLLEALHIPEPDGEKLVLLLGVALGLIFAWLTWSIRGELSLVPRDPLLRAYRRLCVKLGRVGLSRAAHEGAEDFAARVARLRPDLAAEAGALFRRYSGLRYGSAAEGSPQDAASAVRAFVTAVRAFRPARAARSIMPPDSRGSSGT